MKKLSALLLSFALPILQAPAANAQSAAAQSPVQQSRGSQSPDPQFQNRQATDQGLPASDPLFKTVSALDAELFDAYNHCDLGKLSFMVAEGLEFYHDQTGLSVGRQTFLDAIKTNICGKVHRELVPGSMEVYPLKGYGAVEIGVHRFTHPDDPTALGEAKFITIWQLKDGVWTLTRAISFDHHPVAR